MALSVRAVVAPAALAWGATGSLASADWTQFQDGPAHDGAPESATVAPPLKRLWWFHAPDERSGLSGPLIVNGTAISVGEPASRRNPRTSRNASSIDSPSTSGVVSSKTANTALLASEYADIRGGTTTAHGHSRRA